MKVYGPGVSDLIRRYAQFSTFAIDADFRKVTADERKVVMLVGLPNPANALHGLLVADMAAERIAGIGRVRDQAAGSNNVATVSAMHALACG